MGAPAVSLRRVGLLVAMGLSLVGLVAACSDPDQPSTLPSDTPTPTTSSPTSSPSPATVEEAVEAAVRAYYAELTRAAQTNDTSILKTMSTKGCPCYRAVRVIQKNLCQGESTPDAAFVLTMVRVHDVVGRTALVEIKTKDTRYDVLDESGRVVDQVPAQSTHLDISYVRGPNGEWIIGNTVNLGAS